MTKNFLSALILLAGILFLICIISITFHLSLSSLLKSSDKTIIQNTLSNKFTGGIYVATPKLKDDNHTLQDSVYQMPYIDGVALIVPWNSIEAVNNKYDFSVIDKEISRSIKSGKKFSIAVYAGSDTPTWIYEEGVPGNEFTVGPHGGLKRCEKITIPSPWDPTYIKEYSQMMEALASHIKSIPNAYDSMSMVKLTGINEETAELHLPASSKEGTKACTTSNAVPIWQSAGYRPSKIIDAWKKLAGAVDQAFPDKVLGIEIIYTNSFPPINENGDLTTTNNPDYVDVQKIIISSALVMFPGRFEIQWNALGADSPSDTIVEAAKNGAIAGWQTNEFGGFDGSLCNSKVTDPTIVCDNDKYAAILQHGIDEGGRYIEIWQTNAEQFPQAITEVYNKLKMVNMVR